MIYNLKLDEFIYVLENGTSKEEIIGGLEWKTRNQADIVKMVEHWKLLSRLNPKHSYEFGYSFDQGDGWAKLTVTMEHDGNNNLKEYVRDLTWTEEEDGEEMPF